MLAVQAIHVHPIELLKPFGKHRQAGFVADHDFDILAALKHGVNILLDKPLATSRQGGLNIIEAAEKSGKTLMVMRNNRFVDASVFAKKFIEKGEALRIIANVLACILTVYVVGGVSILRHSELMNLYRYKELENSAYQIVSNIFENATIEKDITITVENNAVARRIYKLIKGEFK